MARRHPVNWGSLASAYSSLLAVSEAILQHRELPALFRELANRLRSVVEFDFLTLILFDEPNNLMRLHVLETDKPVERVSRTALPPEDSPAGWVLLHQQPLVIRDIATEPRWPQIIGLLRQNAVQSCCFLPLTTARRRVGALSFGFTHQHEFRDSELDLMQQVAAQVAVAVENTLNAEAAQRYEQQLTHERDRLRVLLEINNALVSRLDRHEVFRNIAGCVRRVIPHEYSSILLRQLGSKNLVLFALDSPPGYAGPEQDAVLPGEHSPATLAIESGRPVVLDREDLARYPSRFIRQLLDDGICSVCCIPLQTRNGILGTVNLASSRPDAFPPAEIEFLSQVAGQAAIAVENAVAYQEIARLKDRIAEEKLYLQEEIRTEWNSGQIVGNSPGWRDVLRQVATVAPTDAYVLILGETGTGKELVARAIHDLSFRKERTFVKLNCAAIPTGLLESELFGHEKGAFTGAIAQKAGRFEVADGGTLFLDEIGDIPLELQPKLLRALQEQEFERLGGTRTLKVDVRVVSATNRDLPRMVAAREFRSDLYYRLNVFPISIPALRERPQDVPELVRYFTSKFARRMNRAIHSIPTPALEALTRYSWPGNVRELENLIERAVILSPGPTLQVPLPEAIPLSPEDAFESLEAAERQHIVNALQRSGWVLGGPNGAAARLGVKRTTLQSRMKKLGIGR